jgi:hypothetical protein
MGADLYIEPLHSKHCKSFEPLWRDTIEKRDAAWKLYGQDSEPGKAAQAKVWEVSGKMYPPELYFRDSYNCFSVLRPFGLSWWRDVSPMCSRGHLSKAKARELAERLKQASLVCEWNPAEWKHASFNGSPVTQEIFESKVKPNWLEERDALVRFLLGFANDKRRGIYLSASL